MYFRQPKLVKSTRQVTLSDGMLYFWPYKELVSRPPRFPKENRDIVDGESTATTVYIPKENLRQIVQIIREFTKL